MSKHQKSKNNIGSHLTKAAVVGTTSGLVYGVAEGVGVRFWEPAFTLIAGTPWLWPVLAMVPIIAFCTTSTGGVVLRAVFERFLSRGGQ